jgi:NAD(P)H dehydrogenase (quinone)
MTIAVSGASGHLGRATADALLERVDPGEVVLITRDPSKLAEYAERGVSVRQGDFNDPASLRGALAGVDRLLIISTDELGKRVQQHSDAIQAAKDAGVRHVLYTSIVNPVDSNPAAVVPEHKGSEQALLASGLDWTLLRNGIYAEFQLPGLEQAIASGTHVHNGGDGVIAYVSRDDCAAAAAAVLSTDGHEGKIYNITGPDALSGADMAAIASEVGGVEVQAVAVDDAAMVAGLVEHAGMPEQIAEFLATFGRAVRDGQLAEKTDDVETLTGRPPQSVRGLLEASQAPAA